MNANPQPVDLENYLSATTEAERELLHLFKKDGPWIFCDVGACEGEDSIRFARLYPSAKIFAFEPLPANQTIIRANFSKHSISKATLIPLALANSEGEAVFHVSSGRPKDLFAGENWNYGNKSSSLLPPAADDPMHGWIKFDEAITVQTTTLDRFCTLQKIRHVDFIHMDVQGAEKLVLEGAAKMLPHITAVWLEVSRKELYRGQALDKEISQLMKHHGFTLAYSTYRADNIEGDHFYVNLRHARTWRYVAGQRLRNLAVRIKRNLFR